MACIANAFQTGREEWKSAMPQCSAIKILMETFPPEKNKQKSSLPFPFQKLYTDTRQHLQT